MGVFRIGVWALAGLLTGCPGAGVPQPPGGLRVGLAASAAAVDVPGGVWLEASVSGGPPSRVEVLRGDRVLASLAAPPYRLEQRYEGAASLGAHAYRARAFAGAASVLSDEVVVVARDLQKPALSLGAAETVGSPAYVLRGTASDNVAVDRVEAALGGQRKTPALDAQGRFGAEFILAAGENRIAVTATDVAGNSSSLEARVTYQPPPPTVQFVDAPAVVTAAGPVAFNVATSANVTQVAFYLDAQPQATDTQPPFGFTRGFGAADNGQRTVRAVAQADTGATAEASVGVQVSIPPPPPGQVSFVGTGTAFSGRSAAIDLGLPPGVRPGDTLLAVLAANTADPAFAAPPPGWTPLPAYPLVGGGSALKALWVWWRTAGAQEPTSQRFALKGAAGARAVLLAYRGASPASPVHLEAHRVENGSALPPTAPAVSTAVPSRMLYVVSLAPANHGRGVVAPAGLTVRYDSGVTLDFTLLVADAEQAAPGAVAAQTFRVQDDLGRTFNDPFTTLTLALAP